MTIEDPIEFLVRTSVHRQPARGRRRHDELRPGAQSALRQDPDVILVGEMRDSETIETALTAAETATWCSPRCTLWTRPRPSPASSPPSAHQQKQVRLQLDRAARRGLAAPGAARRRQGPRGGGRGAGGQLARARDGGGQGPHQGDLHRHRAELHDLRHADVRPVLMLLFRQNVITYEEALRQSSNPTTSRCAPPHQRDQRLDVGTTSTRRTRRRRTARHRPAASSGRPGAPARPTPAAAKPSPRSPPPRLPRRRRLPDRTLLD